MSSNLTASSMKETIEVPLEAVQIIVDWWRGANEAPGGCSALDAIQGMTQAVMEIEYARRIQINGSIDDPR